MRQGLCGEKKNYTIMSLKSMLDVYIIMYTLSR